VFQIQATVTVIARLIGLENLGQALISSGCWLEFHSSSYRAAHTQWQAFPRVSDPKAKATTFYNQVWKVTSSFLQFHLRASHSTTQPHLQPNTVTFVMCYWSHRPCERTLQDVWYKEKRLLNAGYQGEPTAFGMRQIGSSFGQNCLVFLVLPSEWQ
jgi:hypothetical protein